MFSRYAIIFILAAVAGALPFLAYADGDEPPPLGPDYQANPPASDEAALKDARTYYAEGSYAWALAAGEYLAARWPASAARAEGDLILLRCYLQVQRWEDADRAFDAYFKAYKSSPWAADAADVLVDAYSEYQNIAYAYQWEEYLQEKYGYYFYPYGEDQLAARDKLDRRREAILKHVAGIYRGLMAKETGAAREKLADRLVLAYLKMYPYFNWEKFADDAAKNYAERGKYLARVVAALEMSPNMRSMVAFHDGVLDGSYLPVSNDEWKQTGRPDEEYDRWVAEQRFASARANWEAVAATYADAPGALLARAALAHYDVTFRDEPAAAATAFDELADSIKDEYYAELYRMRARHLRAPALAVMNVVADANAKPALKVEMACRIVPEVTLTVYAVDPAKYLELSRKLSATEPLVAETAPKEGEGGDGQNVGSIKAYKPVATAQLPGVKEPLTPITVPTGCGENEYRLKKVVGEVETLAPGLYVVEARAGEEFSRAMFMITGAAAVAAGDGEELFLQMVDGVSGAPVALDAVSAFNVYYKPDAKGYNQEHIEPVEVTRTSRDAGIVVDLTRYEKNSEIYFVLTSALGPAIYDCRTAYEVRPKDGIVAHVITDRPLYRPEAKVSYKGIVRKVDYAEKVLAPVVGQEMDVVCSSPDGAEVWKGKGKTDDFGTLAGEFALPPGAKLGTQSLTLKWKVGDREYSGFGYFDLEEYEKPEYLMTATPAKDRYFSGEQVKLDVVGSYYFGAPMTGAAVVYEIYREGYGPKGYEYDTLMKKGEGVLDAQGRFPLVFATPYGRQFDNYFTVNVKLTDVSQHVVEETFYVTTYNTDRYLSLSVDKYQYRPGEEVKATVYSYDWYNNAVAGDVTVSVYAYDQYAEDGKYRGALLAEKATRTDAEGAGAVSFTLAEAPPMIEVVARMKGTNGAEYETSATAEFVAETAETTVRKPEIGVTVNNNYPTIGDEITVNLESRFDQAECVLTLYAGQLVWVKHVTLEKAELGSGASFTLPIEESFVPYGTLYAVVVKDGASWNASQYIYVNNPNVRMDVKVEVEKAEYRPGEEAQVKITCADPKGLPIAADMSLAAVDDALLALRPDRTSGVPSQLESSLGRYGYMNIDNSLRYRGYMGNAVFWFPYYSLYGSAYGSSFLPLDEEAWGPAAQFLGRCYLPEFVNADLSSWLYIGDTDLLGREPLTWSGYGHMGGGYGYGEGGGGAGLGAVGAASETTVRYRGGGRGDMSFEEAEASGEYMARETSKKAMPAAAPAERGPIADLLTKDADKNAGFAQAKVRQEFLETALWLANLRADAAGVANATVKLPDNLTTWRVMALALDKGQRFGWNSSAFAVNKYIIARLKAPRYMVAGDVARLTAIGHNYLKEAKQLKLTVAAEGLSHVRGDEAKTEEVAADGKATMYDWVEAGRPGRARLVTSALTDVESDAAELFLPVYPHGAQIRQAFAGRLRDEVTHTLTVAEGVAPSSFSAELFVTPSLAATLSHGLGFFKEYPYDCVEQTLNRFRMNALLAGAAADLKLDKSKLSEGLSAAVDEGMARLGEQQTAAGGWPWWKGGRESPYMTAYALDGLGTLKGNPFLSEKSAKKRDEMFAAGEKYLKAYLEDWRKDHERYPVTLSLYIADVALRTGILKPEDDVVREAADFYFDYRSPHNEMSLALLASVLRQLGDEQRLGVVLRNLDNGAKFGADKTLHWGQDPKDCWRWWDDSVETTAKVLEVKLANQPDNPQLPFIVDWLVDQRRGAAWKSTKDSAAATTALIHYILAKPELAAPIVAAYKVGRKEGGMELDPTAYEKPGETAAFAVEDFAVGANEMKLTRTKGEGPVFYTVAVEYYAEAKDLPAVQGSVTLTRDYYLIKKEFKKGKLKETRLPLDRPLKLGEEIEVELKVNSPYDFDYVVLEDPKPAGCIYTETASGYNWAMDAFVELFNKQRSVLFERLAAGETVVRYRDLAEVPGTYAALPARIYGMYSPDIGSNTASATVEVSEEE